MPQSSAQPNVVGQLEARVESSWQELAFANALQFKMLRLSAMLPAVRPRLSLRSMLEAS